MGVPCHEVDAVQAGAYHAPVAKRRRRRLECWEFPLTRREKFIRLSLISEREAQLLEMVCLQYAGRDKRHAKELAALQAERDKQTERLRQLEEVARQAERHAEQLAAEREMIAAEREERAALAEVFEMRCAQLEKENQELMATAASRAAVEAPAPPPNQQGSTGQAGALAVPSPLCCSPPARAKSPASPLPQPTVAPPLSPVLPSPPPRRSPLAASLQGSALHVSLAPSSPMQNSVLQSPPPRRTTRPRRPPASSQGSACADQEPCSGKMAASSPLSSPECKVGGTFCLHAQDGSSEEVTEAFLRERIQLLGTRQGCEEDFAELCKCLGQHVTQMTRSNTLMLAETFVAVMPQPTSLAGSEGYWPLMALLELFCACRSCMEVLPPDLLRGLLEELHQNVIYCCSMRRLDGWGQLLRMADQAAASLLGTVNPCLARDLVAELGLHPDDFADTPSTAKCLEDFAAPASSAHGPAAGSSPGVTGGKKEAEESPAARALCLHEGRTDLQ